MKKSNILACFLSLFLGVCVCRHDQVRHTDKRIANITPWIKTRVEFLKLMPKNGIVAEVGVNWGEFSDLILLYTDPKHLYLIDIWENENQYNQVKDMFADNSRVTVIRIDSIKATKLFEDNSFDWVYIDADHSYFAVKNDLNAWIKKIKPGGMLAGHDYVFLQSVVIAVNEFLLENNLNMTYLSTDFFSSFAVKKN